jgi:hypothetical protein
MRKLIVSVSILFIFAAFAVAQIEEENWQTYSPVNEEFTIETPLAMSDYIQIHNKKKREYSGLYRTFVNGNYYYIFSENRTGDNDNSSVEKLIKTYSPTKIEVEVDNLKGLEYRFVDDEGFYQQILIINSKNRFYIFHALSENENDASLQRFFSSLKFSENNEQQELISEKKFQKSMTNENSPSKFEKGLAVPKKDETGRGKGNGSGNGDSSQSNNLPNNSPTIPTVKPAINTFKLTSQPRANYTDLARQYDINGAVRLKVTFLANGSIGNITVVKKLPFGLTNSAIKAAKAIEFVPGAVPVSKTVEYKFILY